VCVYVRACVYREREKEEESDNVCVCACVRMCTIACMHICYSACVYLCVVLLDSVKANTVTCVSTNRSGYQHLHELGSTTLTYTPSQLLRGVLKFRQGYFGNCNRTYFTNGCCSCMNPPPQEA